MDSQILKIRHALEQVRAALPDVSFAKKEEVDPNLITRIGIVLNSDNLDELKDVLTDTKNALTAAWANHGGVPEKLLDLIENALMTEADILNKELLKFIGTENWYRHPLQRSMTYTDGVRYFADTAESYWLLDIIATEFFTMLKDKPFLVITASAKDNSCKIIVTDTEENEIKSRYIEVTDLPEGNWRFYLTDNVLLLPSEY